MIKEDRWMRETFVDLMIDYAKQEPRLLALDADLMLASGMKRFKEACPDQIINLGVSEANMIGVAAGLATTGKIPVTHTFTPFATRRVCDQVTLSVAYAGLNVKMVGTDPGVTAELNGGTHMSMEDVAIMRNIPGMTVVEPTDSAQLRLAFPQIMAHEGPVYIRLLRRNAVQLFDSNSDFELGKGILMEEGQDVTLIASGIMTGEAIKAAQELRKEKITADVINIHTIKPIDQEIIIKSAQKTGAVVTAENGFVINGLGSAVAEVLGEHVPTPMARVGVKDHFGEVGKTDFLKEKYGLTAAEIIKNVKQVLTRKK